MLVHGTLSWRKYGVVCVQVWRICRGLSVGERKNSKPGAVKWLEFDNVVCEGNRIIWKISRSG
jgi:hypothetical protein